MRKMAGRALEASLNRAVALDAHLAERLVKLDGSSVELTLRGPGLRMRVEIDGDRLRVGPPAENPSLAVAASPGALLAMALRGGETSPGAVEINGDAGLARELETLFAKYKPDFEAALATRLGDHVGVAVADGARSLLATARRSSRHGREDLANWLRDEARLVPDGNEVEDFLDDVDAFRERVERLESRIHHAERDA